MNEEITKNEISEEQLDQVSGGAAKSQKRDGICSVCGFNTYNRVIDGKTYLVCSRCGHKE